MNSAFPLIYRRLVAVGLGLYWMVMFGATHVPMVPRGLDPGTNDKMAHLSAYALLGLALGVVWSAWRGRLRSRELAILFVTAAVYGIFDEATQPLFGRDADIQDWFADLVGTVLGLLLAWVHERLLWRWRPEWLATNS